MSILDYPSVIELTNLGSLPSKQIQHLVKTAEREHYFGVCLQYENIGVASKARTADLKLVTVAGFPPVWMFPDYKQKLTRQLQLRLGYYSLAEIERIKEMCDDPNVDEIDLIFPMYWYLQGRFVRIYSLLKGIRNRTTKPIKVIAELGTLYKNPISLFEIADLIEQSGVNFFKTNTGLIPQDFNILMQGIRTLKLSKPNMPIKASGGIRSVSQVLQLLQLGVERVGTSNLTNDIHTVGVSNESTSGK